LTIDSLRRGPIDSHLSPPGIIPAFGGFTFTPPQSTDDGNDDDNDHSSATATTPRPAKNVVILACDECRTAKLKCDHGRPCSRCREKGIDCRYTVDGDYERRYMTSGLVWPRRKASRACVRCRTSKLECDLLRPCNHCSEEKVACRDESDIQ